MKGCQRFYDRDVGMQKAKLEKYKKSLIDAKREILKELEQEKASLEYTDQGDLVDIADQLITNDILTRLSDMDIEKLKEIEHALEKIENGQYGICEGTGKKIPEARLNHVPWTRYTMEYAEQLERENRH